VPASHESNATRRAEASSGSTSAARNIAHRLPISTSDQEDGEHDCNRGKGEHEKADREQEHDLWGAETVGGEHVYSSDYLGVP